MKKRLFPLLITLSALAVSGSAAFYSVYGLSKLFAGASFQVMIMAGSLEFAKLVVASLLYQYWDTINKGLRAYLSIACFVLILITSGGIYGFLSGAYQSTATKSELLDKSLAILNQKQIRFEETKKDLTVEKTQVTKSISDLRIALSNPSQIQYIDKESGQLITTSSSSARRALQSELKTTITDRDKINLKLEAILDSIGKTDMDLLKKEMSNEDERELGPLKYLSETTGYPMNKVVNWFLLLIVFVFDPLAIALVVAANMAFAQLKKTEKVRRTPKPHRYKKEIQKIRNQNSDEERMDIIGQNGNDGLHYEDDDMDFEVSVDPIEGEQKEIVINTKDLTEKELNDLSREMGKMENDYEEKPINLNKEDLEKLEQALIITTNNNLELNKDDQQQSYYSDDNIENYRLTDTTQTLMTQVRNRPKIDKTEDMTNDEKTKLKYKGRK